jgi:hypothetical protein
MTKQDLLRILEQYPDDIEIYVYKSNNLDIDFDDESYWMDGIREPFINKKMIKDGKIVERPTIKTSGAKKSLIF